MTAEGAVGSDLSSEDKWWLAGGERFPCQHPPFAIAWGHQTTHEALLGLLGPLGYAYYWAVKGCPPLTIAGRGAWPRSSQLLPYSHLISVAVTSHVPFLFSLS